MRRLILIILAAFMLAACSKDGEKQEVEFIPEHRVGAPATDFQYSDMDGKPFRLSEKKGRVVVLYFWRMKCADCKEDMLSLEGLNRKYRDKGLTVVAVGADTMHSAPIGEVREFLAKSAFTFQNIRDDNGYVSEAYDVLKAPKAFVIDKNGNLALIKEGRVDWMGPDITGLVESLL